MEVSLKLLAYGFWLPEISLFYNRSQCQVVSLWFLIFLDSLFWLWISVLSIQSQVLRMWILIILDFFFFLLCLWKSLLQGFWFRWIICFCFCYLFFFFVFFLFFFFLFFFFGGGGGGGGMEISLTLIACAFWLS